MLVETSGAVDVGVLDPRAHCIMDLKCPGSKEEHRNLWANLDHLTGRDEVKFVVADLGDFKWACDVVRRYRLGQRVAAGSLGALLVSPVWGLNDLEPLVDSRVASGLPRRDELCLISTARGQTPPFVHIRRCVWSE